MRAEPFIAALPTRRRAPGKPPKPPNCIQETSREHGLRSILHCMPKERNKGRWLHVKVHVLAYSRSWWLHYFLLDSLDKSRPIFLKFSMQRTVTCYVKIRNPYNSYTSSRLLLLSSLIIAQYAVNGKGNHLNPFCLCLEFQFRVFEMLCTQSSLRRPGGRTYAKG